MLPSWFYWVRWEWFFFLCTFVAVNWSAIMGVAVASPSIAWVLCTPSWIFVRNVHPAMEYNMYYKSKRMTRLMILQYVMFLDIFLWLSSSTTMIEISLLRIEFLLSWMFLHPNFSGSSNLKLCNSIFFIFIYWWHSLFTFR